VGFASVVAMKPKATRREAENFIVNVFFVKLDLGSW
jgi:hypothetical protein